MLRFDGLYISKLPVDYGAMLSYSYLRFYDDGVVIECTVQGDRLTPSFLTFEALITESCVFRSELYPSVGEGARPYHLRPM